MMLPDGSCFETLDNDGVDALIGHTRHLVGGGWMDRLERSWRAVVASVVLACAAGFVFVWWGIPAIALELAVNTPEWIAVKVSAQTMDAIDHVYVAPTKLTEADQARVQALFEKVANTGACGPHTCSLLFRNGRMIGANAFALPDGRIVLTDELWALIKADAEIEGVFAHEMGHVRRAHGLQRAYEASLVPAAITILTGDLSQISQMAVILPGILVQSAYSRDFETEADKDAIATLKKMGENPAPMAALLERMEKKHCGAKGCDGSWLGDHPDTARRAALFRAKR
jgi:Zn-dependent protease with chaperone function